MFGKIILSLTFAATLIEGKANFWDTPTRARADDPMPSFEDSTCPSEIPEGALCIKVNFPDDCEDLMILVRTSETSSTYEGYLQGDEDVTITMIDTPAANTRFINFNSEHVPHCSTFDIDLENATVLCPHGAYNPQLDEFVQEQREIDRAILDANTKGPIIPLGKYYGSAGVPVRAKFTFDSNFYKEFHGKDGKTGDEYMDEVIALVKNAYKDRTLKREIGTIVNIIATKERHYGDLSGARGKTWPAVGGLNELMRMAENGGDYDAFIFITYPGSAGVAISGKACPYEQRAHKISYNKAYGPNDCNKYQPPQRIRCTVTNRIVLTSETVAHELGHTLGMDHDFKQDVYDAGRGYEYRRYQYGAKCRGLMDYIDDGVGWSKCSARDFSRYLTSAGTKKPCLGKVSGGSGGDCTNKVSTTKCNRWARQGDCTNRYPKDYTAWMAKHCKKSCGC